MFGVHVAKVPGHGEAHLATTPAVDLMSGKVITAREGLPLARVEQIAAVDGDGDEFVEEILARSKIHTVVGTAIALGDDLAGAVATGGLYGDVVGQHQTGGHTGVPREVVVGRSGDGLSVDVVTEPVEFIVIGIGRRGKVEDAEEFVLQGHLQT